MRYNISDEGVILDWHDLAAILRTRPEWQSAARQAWQAQGMKLPLLLLFGRKDATISFMGANIYPQDVENGLYADSSRAAQLASFTLTLEERDGGTASQPVVHLELREEVHPSEHERAALATDAQQGIVGYLARVSRDFAQSLEESARTGDIEVRVHDHGTGPFAVENTKLKRVYLQKGTA